MEKPPTLPVRVTTKASPATSMANGSMSWSPQNRPCEFVSMSAADIGVYIPMKSVMSAPLWRSSEARRSSGRRRPSAASTVRIWRRVAGG